MKNMFITSVVALVAIFTLGFNQTAKAHCEIPCGIYEDSVRIALIREHIVTIEKSMKQIIDISKSENPDYNQLVRWVNNKEEHAEKIQEIVSQYFLHQRIKHKDESDKEKRELYLFYLETLHQIQVYAMKAKQTTELAHIEKLNKLTNIFSDSYFKGHKH